MTLAVTEIKDAVQVMEMCNTCLILLFKVKDKAWGGYI